MATYSICSCVKRHRPFPALSSNFSKSLVHWPPSWNYLWISFITDFQAPSETSWTRISGGRDQEHMFFTSFLPDSWISEWVEGSAGKECAILTCLLWFGDDSVVSCIHLFTVQHRTWSESHFIPALFPLLNYQSFNIHHLLCQALNHVSHTQRWTTQVSFSEELISGHGILWST